MARFSVKLVLRVPRKLWVLKLDDIVTSDPIRIMGVIENLICSIRKERLKLHDRNNHRLTNIEAID